MFRVERRGKAPADLQGIWSVKKSKEKENRKWRSFCVLRLTHSERLSAASEASWATEAESLKDFFIHTWKADDESAIFALFELRTVCSYGDLIQPQKFSNTVRGPVCLRRRLFDGLFPRALFRFMFWFLHFLPTADCCRRCSEQRHGSWHCGMWQTGGVRGHGHLPGYGPRSKPFPLEFYSFIYLFFGERFYSAAVILLRFQALEAFVCCRCFDAQQHVVTPADRGRRPVSLWPPHLHPESLHFTYR